jgi:poly(3-hydroxybutyrate) depolymerase
MRPARAAADSARQFFAHPFNPMSYTLPGRHAAAACEVFERTTRRYARPEFGISRTSVGGTSVAVAEECIWAAPFCRLVHFARAVDPQRAARDPRVLLIAPMSGHFATLIRGTVETLLPDHEVFVTDWQDARDVPITAGSFDLDDYVVYLRDMLRYLGGDVHVLAICQSAVPALAAVSLMEEDGESAVPRTLIMAGGPVDTRINPTIVNNLAERRGTDWFRNNVLTAVPWPNAGAGRSVYPGFLQLSGFMSMNLDRHASAHKELFLHLVRGDGDSAEKHRTFYDEYLAVMDLTAEFYIQTIDTVFVRHALAKGAMVHRGRRVDPSSIRRVAVMTVEGEKDDITGRGQCAAALGLCTRVPETMKLHYECPDVGHYGIFNGSRFRNDIAPRMAQFMRAHDPRSELISVSPAADPAAEAAAERAAFARYGSGPEVSSVAFTFGRA